jgi:hypothetical protein
VPEVLYTRPRVVRWHPERRRKGKGRVSVALPCFIVRILRGPQSSYFGIYQSQAYVNVTALNTATPFTTTAGGTLNG